MFKGRGELARPWLEQALTAARSGASFTVMPMVTTSFLRLVTSDRVFQQPTPIVGCLEGVNPFDPGPAPTNTGVNHPADRVPPAAPPGTA